MNETARRIRRLRRELLEARWEVRIARSEARIDDRTGLGNKRAWRETIEDHIAEGSPFWVVVFDLANLHSANKVLGMAGADRLIFEAAQHMRHGDRLGHRIGGDEFAVLMPGAKEEDAIALRDRIEGAIGVRELAPGVSTFVVGIPVLWEPEGPTITAQLTAADFAIQDRKVRRKVELGEPTTRREALERLS
jgi:diguanylate cyclase (GGDEF)-like protein